jgi:uncharacterized protein Yka (UPF0111/DUF47 family)
MDEKLKKLPEDADDALNAFIAQEAQFFSELAKCVETANDILKRVAGDVARDKNVTYVSRQDYKNFFNLSDEVIELWIKYATNVLGREELVRGIDKIKGSYLKQAKNKNSNNMDGQSNTNAMGSK